MNRTSKNIRSDAQSPMPDESEIRAIWNQTRGTRGPSTETMDRVQNAIHMAARQHAHRPPHKQGLSLLFVPWRSIMAAAAALLLLLGGLHVQQQTTNSGRYEMAAIDRQVMQEIDALQVIVWDQLTELEDDALNDDLVLQALTL